MEYSSISKLIRILVIDIWGKFGFKALILVGLMVLNGVMEGVGILFLFPLLNYIGIGEAGNSVVGNFINKFFDIFNFQQDLSTIMGFIIAVFLFQYSVSILQSYYSSRLTHQYSETWIQNLFATYFRAGWPFFVNSQSGKLSNSLISETARLGGAFAALSDLMAAIWITVFYLILSFLLCWECTLTFLAGAIVVGFALIKLIRSSFGVGQKISGTNEEFFFTINESFSNAKYIKSSALEEFIINRLNRIAKNLRHLYFLGSFFPKVLRSIIEFSAIVLLCFILAFSVGEFQADPTELLVMMGLFIRLFPRLTGIQQNFQNFNLFLPAIGTLTRSLNEAVGEVEKLSQAPLPSAIQSQSIGIEIRDLHLSYGDREVLSDVNISIPKGSSVAFVGPSGAGKSTLMDCLLGLVQFNRGSIKINNVEISDLPLNSWRQAVGYVAQETNLFHASIFENITWGCSNSNLEDAIEAAKKAHAHHFVELIPEGYHAIIGDRGVRLSGGERQRIRLAQVLLKNPVLLLLDEATSSLDSESENSILEAIEELRKKITIVTVAHRLSTIRNADIIFVMEGGKIVEQGNWDDLYAKGGLFATLWEKQHSGNQGLEEV